VFLRSAPAALRFVLIARDRFDILTFVLSYFYTMTRKIAKSTERGQITLPKEWRDNFSTNTFIVEMRDDRLIILPLDVEKAENEEILFDADRDNNEKGVSPDEIIRILKKIQHG
jgi:AbrB family looped-hinge helix DNA binding protein